MFKWYILLSLCPADVLEGYNGTIFAYGQTSSGKTHTMEVKIYLEISIISVINDFQILGKLIQTQCGFVTDSTVVLGFNILLVVFGNQCIYCTFKSFHIIIAIQYVIVGEPARFWRHGHHSPDRPGYIQLHLLHGWKPGIPY